jgi:copper homeostasis protein
VEGGLAAQEAGAGRVELCASLVEGGVTPSAGMIQALRSRLSLPLHVLIRPRGGDFCYSGPEFEVMQRDIALAKESGADGVVLGVLREDGAVDLERTGALAALARPLSVTFHRAFDLARDPVEALEDLIRLKIDRLLTSGQEASALEGLGLIADLVRQAGGRIVVMPGGGVHEQNIRRIVEETGVTEIHASGSGSVESRAAHRNARVSLGRAFEPSEYTRRVTDPGRIRAFVQALESNDEV